MIRATFAGFSTAMSALQANQKRLDISGQNLSNMNTPGYTRQALQVSSVNYTNPISHYMNGSEVAVGFGVHMDKVTQIRDPYLDIQYRNQMDKSGYTDAMQASLDRLSDVFDESHVNGIWSAFEEIRSTLINIQDLGKVNDPIYEAEFRSKMQALTNLLNDASNQIDVAEQIEYTKLDGTGTSERGAVEEVNDILRQIGNLNRQIKQNQIFGQQSLELMDERNVLLDELSSYIPIEVTYYKDINYDGKDDGPLYNYDSNGKIIGKREWPDDLRVEMVYTDKNGDQQKLTLVEGTIGSNEDNFGKLEVGTTKTDGTLEVPGKGIDDPTNVGIRFIGFERNKDGTPTAKTNVDFFRTITYDTTTGKPTTAAVNAHFADNSGSIQSSLDMLWKDGKTDNINDKRGYEYYRSELDHLARSFAKVMNELNIRGNHSKPDLNDHYLLSSKDDDSSDYNKITAKNIGISAGWQSGKVQVGTGTKEDENQVATILNMLEAFKSTYPNDNKNLIDSLGTSLGNYIDLDNNTFADYMNHISTIVANDSYNNTNALKTNVTVLNGIQNSRDSVSGVSLDEEASNMMMYMSAYNAASRLMTTLDQALDVLINSTGTVGR